MKIFKFFLLIFLLSFPLFSKEFKENSNITIYSLFIKNPSYHRLYKNIKDIKYSKFLSDSIDFDNIKELLLEILKEDVASSIRIANLNDFNDINEELEYIKGIKDKTRFYSKDYASFVNSASYPKTYSIYKNEKLLRLAKKYGSKIVVDKKSQRIKLLVNGLVAIDSPCTTGAKRKIEPHTKKVYNKETPSGVFKIKEKIANKRSNIFGRLYRYGKVVFKGDRRKYKGPPAKYSGALLKNWMRLTDSGIGIHGSSFIKRYPASNGCIRVPYSVVDKIFNAVKPGTKVIIR